jgi:hypothetical protein
MTAATNQRNGAPIYRGGPHPDLLARRPRVLPGGIFATEVGINASAGIGQRRDAIYIGFRAMAG